MKDFYDFSCDAMIDLTHRLCASVDTFGRWYECCQLLLLFLFALLAVQFTTVQLAKFNDFEVLQGSELKYEVQLGDIPCVLHLFMNDGGMFPFSIFAIWGNQSNL